MSVNTGAVDLQSVLNVRRRTLAGTTELPQTHLRYSDAIYLKRIDDNHNIFNIKSRIVLFGELNVLRTIFERYTTIIYVVEENSGYRKNSFTGGTFGATEEVDEDSVENEKEDDQMLPIVSTLKRTSIGRESPPLSSSPALSSSPPLSSSPLLRKSHSIVRSQSVDYVDRLQGKRYGNIELPSMNLMEILEILLKNHFEITNVSSDYLDDVLHQNFVFSKSSQTSSKGPLNWFHRSGSMQS
ncbi:unnamed protein product [Didymodactylos carnosus]|uniref:Uncharacterized protein n=1 Tax=Didymodactylos carnosus TaxID=1234261 RepID=A0A814DVP7_9BILA|nr:unnamed protein product [Didymodactylos carnosus]CAF1394850.1 unnamed protein product [Didymodactylos carnosus]CAF3734050.1 unnamed protein product [Didymodactylos carnosus]CAF4202304.1 unnamed protein product [Didymodactylos carnosus]